MAQINLTQSVVDSIKNDDVISSLQDLIHIELQKPLSDIDAGFIDECVDTILAIRQQNDSTFVPLVPLISSDSFLTHIISSKSRWNKLNRSARIAIIAAVIASSTFTANAAINSLYGVDIIENIGSAFSQLFKPDNSKDEMIPDSIASTTTQIPADDTKSTSHIIGGVIETPEESIDGEDDLAESTTESTKNPLNTTNHAVLPPSTPDISKDVRLESLSADFTDFKTAYIYGETLDYSGVRLTASYTDGTEKEISVSDCYVTRGLNMSTTADYTLRIVYQSCMVSVDITVRPDEETRHSRICSDGMFDYLLTDNGAYITSYNGSDTAISASYLGDSPIYAVASDAFKNVDMTYINLPTVKKIFDNAFKDNTSLVHFSAPNAIYIGDYAFDGCTSLGEIIISPNANHIGVASFRRTAISSITIPSGVKSVPNSLCENCSNLESVHLASGTNMIGSSSFENCSALEQVINTADIEVVGDSAFAECTLTELDSTLQKLRIADNRAFYNCNSISFGNLSANIESIGISSFAFCYGLTKVVIPASITTVRYEAFRGAHISSLTISEGVKTLEQGAFMSINATEICLPDSLENIGQYSLYITKLRKLHFGSNVSSMTGTSVYKHSRLTFYVKDKSYPLQYALDNGITFVIEN